LIVYDFKQEIEPEKNSIARCHLVDDTIKFISVNTATTPPILVT